MSYEEDYSTEYRASCACGRGFLKYKRIHMSNDWGQSQEYNSAVEISCDSCKEAYRYERIDWADYLVPKELPLSKEPTKLDGDYHYNEKERFVQKRSKEEIQAILTDMTAPKHRYIKDLSTGLAVEFANEWYNTHRKKSLSPMIAYLREILESYDELQLSIERKKPYWDQYAEAYRKYTERKKYVAEYSCRLSFQEVRETEEERNARIEKQKYADFTATVHYDDSFRKDLVGHHWDSFYIKECVDEQHLSLFRSLLGTGTVTIAKKYACVCTLCGKNMEILSSDMKIAYEDGRGYYPMVCCDCHSVSSFEAKTMEILNQLGITYIREKTYEGLVGEGGGALRFDFALYRDTDTAGVPAVDLLIELQGPHHFVKGFFDETGEYITEGTEEWQHRVMEDRFAKQFRHDERKKEFCAANGLALECIKYTFSGDYERLENKLIEILRKYGYDFFAEKR